MEGGDSYTTVSVLNVIELYNEKWLVIMVYFILCIFYHNKNKKVHKDKENEHYVLEAEKYMNRWQEADLADQERWIPSRQ